MSPRLVRPLLTAFLCCAALASSRPGQAQSEAPVEPLAEPNEAEEPEAKEEPEATLDDRRPGLAVSAITEASAMEASDPPPELLWKRNWRRVGVFDFVLTGVAASVAIVASAVGPNQQDPRRGGILFDEDVRDALKGNSLVTEDAAQDISDIFLAITTSYPIMIDAVPLSIRSRSDI